MRTIVRTILCVSAALTAAPAAADLVRLRSGGEVRGQLRAGHSRDPQLVIDTLTGGVVVIDRSEVEFTSIRSREVEEYETRSKTVANTVEDRWSLAEWCRQNRLRTQRAEQLELLLLIDPDHVESHKALGHVQYRGEWMTREAQMAQRGYVLHQGRYVTQQEYDQLAKSESERAAEREWFAKVRAWVRFASGANERQRQEGTTELQQITDPAAVPALVTHMAEHGDPGIRRLMVASLSNIPGVRPVKPLIVRSLQDADATIRDAALSALKPEQYAPAIAELIPALLHNDNQVVNRAGAALGRIGDRQVVPALIDALVTSHRYQVKVPVGPTVTVGLAPVGSKLADPNALSQYLPAEVEVALRTGQIPFGAVVLPAPGVPQEYRTYKVQVQLPNEQVLLALRKITGQNLGYDERGWKLWWTAEGQQGAAAS